MYGSRCSARPRPRALYTLSTKSISIHHSQSSQSISIYDREIGAKISVSVSLFLVWCTPGSDRSSENVTFLRGFASVPLRRALGAATPLAAATADLS